MLNKEEVINDLTQYSNGDASIAIAKLILIMCERLKPIQRAYLNKQTAMTNEVKKDKQISSQKLIRRIEQKSLPISRILCKIRSRIGYFWYCNSSDKKIESKFKIASFSTQISKNRRSLGDLVVFGIRQIQHEFVIRQKYRKNANKKLRTNQVQPTDVLSSKVFPPGLENGLLDGFQSLIGTNRFSFEDTGHFKSPILQTIFNSKWRNEIRRIIGTKVKSKCQRSIDKRVGVLHRMLVKHHSTDKSSTRDLQVLLSREPSTIEMDQYTKHVDSSLTSSKMVPYFIEGIGIGKSIAEAGETKELLVNELDEKRIRISKLLKEFWALSEAQRDYFIAHCHNDAYLGLPLNDIGKSKTSTEKSSHTENEIQAVDKSFYTCFILPQCMAFLPNCYLRIDNVMPYQKVHVVIFKDGICCFAAQDHVQSFTSDYLVANMKSLKSLREKDAAKTRSKATPNVVVIDDRNGTKKQDKIDENSEKIFINAADLLYYVTFEEIVHCTDKYTKDKRVDMNWLVRCTTCCTEKNDPDHKRLRDASIHPTDITTRTPSSEPSLNLLAPKYRLHLFTMNCHASLVLSSEAQSIIARNFVTNVITAVHEMITLHKFNATFPRYRSTNFSS